MSDQLTGPAPILPDLQERLQRLECGFRELSSEVQFLRDNLGTLRAQLGVELPQARPDSGNPMANYIPSPVDPSRIGRNY